MEGSTQRARTAVDEPEDEELVARYRAGDARAAELVLTRYRGFARMKARSYFLIGGDREDLVQEALIGLYKAIRDFDLSKPHPFRAFADVCVTRQVITAIKGATRHKHGPLNSYVSFSVTPEEDEGSSLRDRIVDIASDPADLVVSHDEASSIRSAFDELLSPFERKVLHLYVEGKTYEEIGTRLGRGVKPIDNAIQRIKRKLETHLRRRAIQVRDPDGVARP